MNKKIQFNYDGVDYTLEYDRKAVNLMEANGLDLNAIHSKPSSMISILWQGAFLKNHRKETAEKVQEMYDRIPNKSELNEALQNMIIETYSVLIGDNDSQEDPSKNITWKMS